MKGSIRGPNDDLRVLDDFFDMIEMAVELWAFLYMELPVLLR